MTQIEAARHWYKLGHTPLPTRADGTKAPAVQAWREWQTRRPTAEEIDAAFTVDHDGLGVLTGTPRPDGKQLLMIEAEGRAVAEGIIPALTSAMADHDADDLWQRVTTGYSELTPSGGIHWYVLVDGPAGRNTKLARRPSTPAELETSATRVQVLLETRGEGGYSVIAPSAGRTHPTGKAWMRIAGTPETIPTITVAERDLLFAVANVLDQMPEAATSGGSGAVGGAKAAESGDSGDRPGDHYNRDGDWDILLRHGWQIAWRRGRLIGWTRPGKKVGDGISATTGRDPDADRLYVFTTSTEFEAEEPYNRLGVLAVLEHGGDYTAAAKALAAQGWGGTTHLAEEAQKAQSLDGIIAPTSAPTPATKPTPTPTIEEAPRMATVTTITPQGSASTHGTAALAVTEAPVTSLDLARYGQTEDGVARALVARCADDLRFCAQREMWLAWDGTRWVWDEAERHREHAKQLARQLPDNDTWKKFRARALSASGIAGIVRLARTDPAISVHIDDLDSHPWELNTPGGVIDMRTGELSTPERSGLHTRSTTVTPDYESPAPTWQRFLDDTFGGNVDMISYVQRLLGVSAVGIVVEQCLPFAFGSGANGKSTLLGVVMRILGSGRDGYAIALDSEALMVRRHSEHPAELAQLAGARMVVSSEIEDGRRFAEARVKQLTGGDPISARFMRGNPFTFTPTHTLWLAGNSKPGASTSDALWRRIKLLPFEHVVPEGERDTRLETKLLAEAPQILAWIARGAAAYHRDGLGTPDAVRVATEIYREDSDSVGKFVAERCMMTSAGRVRAADLRTAYEAFCKETGDTPVSAKGFGEALRDKHGVELSKGSSGVRMYSGVALFSDEDEPEPDDWRDR